MSPLSRPGLSICGDIAQPPHATIEAALRPLLLRRFPGDPELRFKIMDELDELRIHATGFDLVIQGGRDGEARHPSRSSSRSPTTSAAVGIARVARCAPSARGRRASSTRTCPAIFAGSSTPARRWRAAAATTSSPRRAPTGRRTRPAMPRASSLT